LPEAVIPSNVHGGEEPYLSLAYGNMMGLVVEAIKELSDQVKTLTKRIDSLENGS
jgi:hypothetical protein